MARSKHVVHPNMVAHLWNAQAQDEARAVRAGHKTIYFEGRRIWSYGSHFLAGILLPDNVALLNSDKYSATTTGHMQTVAGACSNRTRYYVPELTKLNRLGIFDSGKTSNGIEAAKAFIIEHATTIPADTAAYLLGLCHVKDPAEAFERIKARKLSSIARAEQSEATAQRKKDAAYGAAISGLTGDSLSLWLDEAFSGDNSRNTAGVLNRIKAAHSAVKHMKRDTQTKGVWNVLKAARARVAFMQKMNEARDAHNVIRQTIRNFRASSAGVNQWFFNPDAHANRLYPASLSATASKLATILEGYPRVAASLRATEALADQALAEYHLALITAADDLRGWLSGERAAIPSSIRYLDKTFIRARDVERNENDTIIGGTLQTSKGADVPLVHAVRAFRFIKLVRERGRPWERNGHSLRVGHFTIDRIATSGDFKAGCHNIQWSEVKRLAASLGVLNVCPMDTTEASAHAA